jgi:hypothetical protein
MHEKSDDYLPTTVHYFPTSPRPLPADPRIAVGVYITPSLRALHMSSYRRNGPRYQLLG